MALINYAEAQLITFLPKGINEISSNLKCWRPQGRPIIVIERSNPIKKWVIAVISPPENIQITFAIVERQPVLLLSLTTFLPKGHNTNGTSLKHWNPHGAPIIVMHNTTPPIK